jgi:hypothetical protein
MDRKVRLEIQHSGDPLCAGQQVAPVNQLQNDSILISFADFAVSAANQVETLHLNTAGEITEEDCKTLK